MEPKTNMVETTDIVIIWLSKSTVVLFFRRKVRKLPLCITTQTTPIKQHFKVKCFAFTDVTCTA